MAKQASTVAPGAVGAGKRHRYILACDAVLEACKLAEKHRCQATAKALMRWAAAAKDAGLIWNGHAAGSQVQPADLAAAALMGDAIEGKGAPGRALAAFWREFGDPSSPLRRRMGPLFEWQCLFREARSLDQALRKAYCAETAEVADAIRLGLAAAGQFEPVGGEASWFAAAFNLCAETLRDLQMHSGQWLVLDYDEWPDFDAGLVLDEWEDVAKHLSVGDQPEDKALGARLELEFNRVDLWLQARRPAPSKALLADIETSYGALIAAVGHALEIRTSAAKSGGKLNSQAGTRPVGQSATGGGRPPTRKPLAKFMDEQYEIAKVQGKRKPTDKELCTLAKQIFSTDIKKGTVAEPLELTFRQIRSDRKKAAELG